MVLTWPSAWLALAAGGLSCLSPCVLPLLPVYLALITRTGSRRALIGTLFTFILGFTLVFIALGTAAGLIGSLVLQHLPVIRRIAGIIVVTFGLYLLGVVRIPRLDRDTRQLTAPGPGALGSFWLGMAFATGWTPCVGPVLGFILLLATGEGSAVRGAILLGLYAVGMSIPLLVVGLLLRQATARFMRLAAVSATVTGWLLVVTGIAMVAGWLDLLPAVVS